MGRILQFGEGEALGRYGENWHQWAKRYLDPAFTGVSALTAKQVFGPPPGFNNYRDSQAALDTITRGPTDIYAVAGIKHRIPCCYATGLTQLKALERAWQGDPEAAFGSVLGFSHLVSLEAIRALSERPNPDGKKGWFFEVMLAPGIEEDALEYLRGRRSKENVRVLVTGPLDKYQRLPADYLLPGGDLEQEPDNSRYLVENTAELLEPAHPVREPTLGKDLMVGVVTKRKPTEEENQRLPGLLDFSTDAVTETPSNAIVIAREYMPGQYQVIGVGAGQPKRKQSTVIAVGVAHENLLTEFHVLRGEAAPYEASIVSEHVPLLAGYRGGSVNYAREELGICVLNSDAFAPFADTLRPALDAGVRIVVQPGGSHKDQDTIDMVDGYGGLMFFTGRRHFKH